MVRWQGAARRDKATIARLAKEDVTVGKMRVGKGAYDAAMRKVRMELPSRCVVLANYPQI